MISMWLCFLLVFDDPTWEIKNTGIYQPLRKDEVIVSPEGEVYILNFKEAHISRYSAEGEKQGVIGYKGRGPGGLTYPTDFFLQDGKLYVMDVMTASINLFEGEGKFIKQVRLPSRQLAVTKVANGWVYGDWRRHGPSDNPPRVFWADPEFETTTPLFELKSTGKSAGLMIESVNGEVTAVYNPINSSPIMAASPKGDRVYLAEPEGFEIKVIDVAKKAVVHTIQRSEEPIPFDENWGAKKLKEAKNMMPPHRRNTKVKGLFPDYFPIIRDFIVAPNGLLVVNKWAGDPENLDHAVAVDEDGKVIDMPFSWEVYDRLTGIRDGWAYVTTFDKDEEEAGLARCSLDAVEKFITDHPIVFEGTAGRRIAIND